jgi:DNA-binding transcriptional regulator LsrR (DeoR family)
VARGIGATFAKLSSLRARWSMKDDEMRTLVEICKMYYIHGLSQQQIAAHFYISRPQVSKLLSKAKKLNIVTININDPFAEERLAVEELKKYYPLEDAIVVDTEGKAGDEAFAAIANNVSLAFTSCVSSGSRIGVSSGFTVSACSRHTGIYNCRDLIFIPLVAGESPEGKNWYANENCRRFANRFNGKYMVLNTPMVIRDRKVRRQICLDSAIKPVLDSYDRLDVLLLGIGELDRESTLGRWSPFSVEELSEFYDQGIRAMFGASFIDANGNEASPEKSDYMIGIKVHQIKRCKTVIGVAIGEKKKEAIRAVLKGGLVNIICTDLKTARLLAEKDGTNVSASLKRCRGEEAKVDAG